MVPRYGLYKWACFWKIAGTNSKNTPIVAIGPFQESLALSFIFSEVNLKNNLGQHNYNTSQLL